MMMMGRPKFSPKTVPSPSTITTPSNTPIPRPTPLTIPNGSRIQSAILPQYTFRTDRETDRPTDRQMGYRRQARNMSRLRSLDRSDAAKNRNCKQKTFRTFYNVGYVSIIVQRTTNFPRRTGMCQRCIRHHRTAQR